MGLFCRWVKKKHTDLSWIRLSYKLRLVKKKKDDS